MDIDIATIEVDTSLEDDDPRAPKLDAKTLERFGDRSLDYVEVTDEVWATPPLTSNELPSRTDVTRADWKRG